MLAYFLIKLLHIISSAVLFGTGVGIAFFMFRSVFTENLQEKYYAARTTVLADYLFTLPAVIIQPLTGFWLIYLAGYNWASTWLVWTYILYIVVGCCWLPVVWIQIQLKNMIQESLRMGTVLPPRYKKLFRIWFMLGFPAFAGLIVIFYLMIAKPV